MSAKNDVAGAAWDARHPLPRAYRHDLLLLALFYVYLNDEDKSVNQERMFHVHTDKPADDTGGEVKHMRTSTRTTEFRSCFGTRSRSR